MSDQTPKRNLAMDLFGDLMGLGSKAERETAAALTAEQIENTVHAAIKQLVCNMTYHPHDTHGLDEMQYLTALNVLLLNRVAVLQIQTTALLQALEASGTSVLGTIPAVSQSMRADAEGKGKPAADAAWADLCRMMRMLNVRQALHAFQMQLDAARKRREQGKDA